MKLIIVDNYEEMSRVAAGCVIDFITQRPQSVIGLTTGNTPMGLYRNLAQEMKDCNLFEQARIFLTEEYLGTDPNDRRSLYSWLHRSFLGPCRIADRQIVRLLGEDAEPQLACMAYEEELSNAGGFDLLVEGIGINGHIGFNEPGSQPNSRTRVVALHEDTQDYNEGYWNESVPEYGMTIGIANILEAKNILLMASGVNKAEALMRAIEAPKTPEVPCSYLQNASQLTVVADRNAASLLKTTASEGWKIG